eukprot:scpid27820/ scgid8391/ Tetratricopeptide repeat protein 25
MGEPEQAEPELPYKACVAVGCQYAGKGQYKNAMRMFDTASEMADFDNEGRVARSSCYLKMGQPKDALAEAQEALAKDSKCIKALLMKAEAHYAMGEFEWAMVDFHRGLQRRPEIVDFRRGVDKCTEAVDNAVGNVREVEIKETSNISFLKEDSVAQMKKKVAKKAAPTQTFVGAMAQKMQMMDRKKKPEKKVKESAKTVKQLLGELYHDKAYLEQLLGDGSPFEKSDFKEELTDMAKDGIGFLEKQTEFWRKQQPIYSRKNDYLKRQKKKTPELTTTQLTKKYLEILVDIDSDILDGKAEQAVRKCESWLKRVHLHSTYELPDKLEVLANLNNTYGNALLDVGRYADALEAHKNDLEFSTKSKSKEAVSRAHDNIGRAYAKLGRHKEAVAIWQKKVNMITSYTEKAWVMHEMGRSYIELGHYDEAAEYARMAQLAAEEGGDDVWVLNARVMEAQCHSKLDDPLESHRLYLLALAMALNLKDDTTVDAVTAAIDDLEDRLKLLGLQAPFDGKTYDNLPSVDDLNVLPDMPADEGTPAEPLRPIGKDADESEPPKPGQKSAADPGAAPETGDPAAAKSQSRNAADDAGDATGSPATTTGATVTSPRQGSAKATEK